MATLGIWRGFGIVSAMLRRLLLAVAPVALILAACGRTSRPAPDVDAVVAGEAGEPSVSEGGSAGVSVSEGGRAGASASEGGRAGASVSKGGSAGVSAPERHAGVPCRAAGLAFCEARQPLSSCSSETARGSSEDSKSASALPR